MRIILPTGEYPIDGLWDFKRMPLAEVEDFHRAVEPGVNYLSARTAIGGLLQAVDGVIGDDIGSDVIGQAVAAYPELVSSLTWLVWIVRHRAGERQPNGAPLTMAEVRDSLDLATDIVFRRDPGDDRGGGKADPRRPRTRGSKARGGSSRAASR